MPAKSRTKLELMGQSLMVFDSFIARDWPQVRDGARIGKAELVGVACIKRAKSRKAAAAIAALDSVIAS